MSPYTRLAQTLHMQAANTAARRLVIGLHVPSISTQHLTVPRAMHALTRVRATWPNGHAQQRSLWHPFFGEVEHATQEARAYGLAAHRMGDPTPPQREHLLIVDGKDLEALPSERAFDVAFVPARPHLIDAALERARATVVVSDMWDDLLEVGRPVFNCPSVQVAYAEHGADPELWQVLLREHEPIPGLIAAVDQWSAEAIAANRAQYRGPSNELAALHLRALQQATTLEGFRQAVEAEGAYPTRGMLLFTRIARQQGTPNGTQEAAAVG